MKQVGNDKLLREKINKLNPLSGGIVFGKEEAWEKLQQRMDSKPARKIPVKYWLTAAAVLLLFICVTALYNHPAKEVVHNNVPKINDHTGVAQQQALIIPQPENVQEKKSLPAIGNKSKHIPKISAKKVEQPVITVAQQVQIPENENKVDNNVAIINTPAPVVPSPKQMKVLHINDVEHKEASKQITPAYVVNKETININKLPTVHINEVERQEVEIRNIRRENRMTLGHYLFFRPTYSDIERMEESRHSEEYTESHNLIKSILNLQN